MEIEQKVSMRVQNWAAFSTLGGLSADPAKPPNSIDSCSNYSSFPADLCAPSPCQTVPCASFHPSPWHQQIFPGATDPEGSVETATNGLVEPVELGELTPAARVLREPHQGEERCLGGLDLRGGLAGAKRVKRLPRGAA